MNIRRFYLTTILTLGAVFTANAQTAVITEDNITEAQLYTSQSVIEVELTGTEFVNSATPRVIYLLSFTLTDAPPGVSITNITTTSTTTADVTLEATQDFDEIYSSAYITINDTVVTSSTGDLTTDFIEFQYLIESVAVTGSSNLDEANLDNGTIVLTLTNDSTTTIGALTETHFTFTNFPSGTTIENITSDATGKIITINLNYTPGNFDNDIIAQISVLPSILTQNTGSSLTTGDITITATPGSAAITEASRTEAQLYTLESVIEVVLTETEFENSATPRVISLSSFTLNSAPDGVTITNITTTSTTTADVTLAATLDFDATYSSANITIIDDEVTGNTGALTTDNIEFQHLIESAGLSSSPVQLDESNMDGSSYIRIPLTDETFVNYATLSELDFTLFGFPTGVGLTSMKTDVSPMTSATEAVIFIDYTPDDFDADYTTAYVSIDPAKLVQSSAALLTSQINVQHLIESVAITGSSNLDEQNLNNGTIELTLTNDETTTKGGSIPASHFTFTNFPSGYSIESITSDAAGEIITILLNFSGDFGADITNAQISVLPSILTYNTGSSLTTGTFTITAAPISAAITEDNRTEAQLYTAENVIEVVLTEIEFKTPLPRAITGYTLNGAPPGVSITDFQTTSATTADVTLAATQDFDATYSSANITIDEAELKFNVGDLTTDNIEFIHLIESVAKTDDSNLDEANLDDGMIELTLTNDKTNIIGSISETHFTFTNLPPGTTIESITSDATGTIITILLNFSGLDFDIDYDNQISVLSSILTQNTGGSLTTGTFTITATVPSAAITEDNRTEAQLYTAESVIEVVLNEAEFEAPGPPRAVTGYTLNGAPPGVSITSFVTTSTTTADVTLAATQDFDATFSSANITIDDAEVTSNIGDLTTDNIEFIHLIESVAKTDDNNLEEQYLDDGMIELTLDNDKTTTIGLIDEAHFTFTNFPSGITIEDITSDATGTIITINLNFTPGDFDDDITDAQISVLPTILTQNTGGSLTTGTFTIAETPVSVDITEASRTEAQLYTAASVIHVVLTGTGFENSATPRAVTGYTLTGAPPGVSITSFVTTSRTTADVTLAATLDFDATFSSANITIDDAEVTSGIGDLTTDNIEFQHLIESAGLSSSPVQLDESNMDGTSYIRIPLTDETFVNYASLSASDFTLFGFPTGVGLTSMKTDVSPMTSATEAVIFIDYTPDDFDADYTNAYVSIDPAKLVQSSAALLTSQITVQHLIESVAVTGSSNLEEQYLDNGTIVLTLTNDETTTKGVAIPASHFTFTNFPSGTTIEGITSDGSGKIITINLNHVPGDFDIDYDAQISVLPSILTYNTGSSLTTGNITITHTPVSVDITEANRTEAQLYTAESVIHVVLTGTGFENSATPRDIPLSSFILTGAPPGVSISNITTTSRTTADVTLKAILDFDVTYPSANIRILDAEVTSNTGNHTTDNIEFQHLIESAGLSSSPVQLVESNMDGSSYIRIPLTNETFVDHTLLSASDFTLVGFPTGVSLTSMKRDVSPMTSATEAVIYINYTPDDFDANYTSAYVSINPAKLVQSSAALLTSQITVQHLIESVAVTGSSNLDEQNLNDGTIILTLSNDETTTKGGSIPASHFTFTNFPSGTTIEGITSDGTGKIITINLNYTPGDFDSDITNAQISFLPSILTYNTGSSLTTGSFLITAKKESVAITNLSNLDEQNLNKGSIELTITNDQTITSGEIDSIHFRFNNFPTGTTIDSIGADPGRTIITIMLNFDNYYDFDNPINNAAIAVRRSILTWNRNDSLPTPDFLIADYKETPQALMTPSSWLREFFLDTMSIDIKFKEEVFKRNISINKADFGINNGPQGLSINGLTNLADSSVTLQLAFDGTDYDDSLTNVMIAINHEVLVQQKTDSLRTDPFTILPNIEPVINDISFANDTMLIGDLVEVTINLAEFTADSVYTLASGKIGGYPVDSIKWVSDNQYKAWFTIAEGGNDYLPLDPIPIDSLQLDDFPVSGVPFNFDMEQDNDFLDAKRPVVKSLTVLGAGNKRIGDEVIILISAFEENLVTEDSSEINQIPVTQPNVVFSDIGGGTYTLAYTIAPDDHNVDTGLLETKIYLRDLAGNISSIYPKIKANKLTIDADAPSIISMTNTSTSSSAIIGDTVELTIVSDGTNYLLTEESKVNGIKPEFGLILDRIDSTYFVRYIVKKGDNAVLVSGALEARITLVDPSGNKSDTVTTITDNTVLVYPEKPTATLTGNDEICYNDTATLFVNLTGITDGPWDITYSDADSSYQVLGITSSPHTIRVSPRVNRIYQMDFVTDGTGNFNTGAGKSTVTVNPLPLPVIDNLRPTYATTDSVIHVLKGTPDLGVFSGPGVSNPEKFKYVFKPPVAGLTGAIPHIIKYEYTDDKGCYEDTTQEVHVVKADVAYTFQEANKWACYLDDSYTIVVKAADSEGNGRFTITPSDDNTPDIVGSLFSEESWDPVSFTDTLILHPSVFNWGEPNYNDNHSYIVNYIYTNTSGVEVEANETPTLGIEYFDPARITSPFVTNNDEFCSAANPMQIEGNYVGTNAVFYGGGIKELGGAAYQFVPELADTGVNTIIYEYTAIHGCVQRDSAIIIVNQTPEPRLTRIDSCLASIDSDSIRFLNITDTSGLGPVMWKWTFGDAGSGPANIIDSLFTMDTVLHKYENLGKYTVTLEAKVIATGCVQDNATTSFFETFKFGNTPAPDLRWTTECDKGVPISISSEAHTVDTVANYQWTIKDQAENNVMYKEGTDLSTLDFVYSQRGIYSVEVDITTKTGCSNTKSELIQVRPYYQDITIDDPVIESFEAIAEGWSSHAQVMDEKNSWKWEQAVSGEFPYSSGNTSKSWFTDLTEQGNEHSFIESPCFGFRKMHRPMVRMDYRSISDRDIDGAVLQYKVDTAQAWTNVGAINDGSINWYNSFRIQQGPGGQGEGWTGPFVFVNTEDWKTGMHELDPLIGKSAVQFRVAFSDMGTSVIDKKGFAFDNFWIGERTRVVLIEHFTNSGLSGIDATDRDINMLVDHNKLDVIDLHYHAQVDGLSDQMNIDNPAPASARSLFYGTRKAPYTLMDGGVNGSMIYDYEEEFFDTLDLFTRALTDPFFNIGLATTSSAGKIDVIVDIKALEDMAESEYILYVVIVEKGVNGYQNVVRDMLPSTAGITMLKSWTSGETKSFPLSYTVRDYLSDQDDLFIVAFIQDAASKIVYQAASNDTDLNSDPPVVSSRPVKDYLSSRNLEMLVYPNPATNQAYIAFAELLTEAVELQVFSHTGRLMNNDLLPAGTETYKLDVSGLEKGVYFIRAIQRGNVIGVQKLMIMH